MEALNNTTEQEVMQHISRKIVFIVPFTGYVIMGSMIALTNLLLIGAILSHKKLRRKEFLTLSGLAFGDLIYGKFTEVSWPRNSKFSLIQANRL